jgi:hypothetical protein
VDLIERASTTARRHPWETARASFVIELLARRGLLLTGRNWLDVGAGDAWMADQLVTRLPQHASITCWDINYDADEPPANDPRITLVRDEPEARFDRILMLDVIEHVANDRAFVQNIIDQRLERSGAVLVTVPAHASLFSAHDTALRHFRRYSPRVARGVLRDAGLTVVADGGLFASLMPPRALQVWRERSAKRSGAATDATEVGVGAWTGGVFTTQVLERVLRADARASLALDRASLSMPGLSYWALCEPRGER